MRFELTSFKQNITFGLFQLCKLSSYCEICYNRKAYCKINFQIFSCKNSDEHYFVISPLLLLATHYTSLFCSKLLHFLIKTCNLRNRTDSVNPCIASRSYSEWTFTKNGPFKKLFRSFWYLRFCNLNKAFVKIFMERQSFFRQIFKVLLKFSKFFLSFRISP